MNRKSIYSELVKELTGVGGIEGHFCDWNSPRHWVDNKPTPAEVEKWVVKRIKEILEIESEVEDG